MTLTEQYKKERSITENKDYYVVDNKGCSFIDFFGGDDYETSLSMFDIAPVEDWTQSLRKVGE